MTGFAWLHQHETTNLLFQRLAVPAATLLAPVIWRLGRPCIARKYRTALQTCYISLQEDVAAMLAVRRVRICLADALLRRQAAIQG
jgi:hypothetical protein